MTLAKGPIAFLTAAAAALASGAGAQAREKSSGLVVVAPGAQYEAGGFTRAVFGSGWRDVWVTPVRTPVLDLATYAGGLKLDKRGGGSHSLVLHFDEENGWREYRFRSVDKFPMQGLPDAFKGTAVGRIVQDQVSVLFPAAPLLVPPLLDAVGVLHVTPDLYVMGDSPRLEKQRDSVAGMLGTMELKGKEGPDDKPGFAGSRSIKETDKFFEDLVSSRAHRVDERGFLAARLIDFLINDPDRTPDNWDWARFGEKGAYTWRPLPRDRDQAFVDANGLLNALVTRRLYPKQITFGNTIPLKGLTHTTHWLDRRLLQRLTADDFREVALRVQRAVNDSVIGQVVARMPAEARERTRADERVASVLRARREQLPDVAMAFYRQLSREVDLHGTDEADQIAIVRNRDGSVTVTVTDPEPRIVSSENGSGQVETVADGTIERAGETLYYTRTFVPSETNEIRVHAHGGNDVAVVGGVANKAIKVRIIGDKGDDVLADSAGGGATFLYDAEGKNELLTASGTHVSTRAWKPPPMEVGFRLGGEWHPDWGGSKGWAPVVDYHNGAGIILGGGPRFKKYGFRRLPYQWRGAVNFMVGTENGRVGATGDFDYVTENSPLSYRLVAQATQLETSRFFGFGNETPEPANGLSLVDQQMVTVEPSLVWHVGWRAREGAGNPFGDDTVKVVRVGMRPLVGELRVGPVLGWIDPEPRPGSPLAAGDITGASAFALAGAQLGFDLDRTDSDPIPTRGWRAEANVAAYPALTGLDKAFGTARGFGVLYLPLSSDGGPNIALRAGGSLAEGGFPAQYSAFVGGRSTLRGYSWRRFAGDAAADGSAEFRVPVGKLNFLLRSDVGVFALADAGRVWFDGESDGGWHTAVGGGVWFSVLGKALSVAYAHGEKHAVYIHSGLFY